MSQHGCPERLSSRSKGFQEDGASQPTMEVLVETLTGTAFEMTVSPSDTIFAIKSKICRVEGIPVSQQHLLYNLAELEDGMSLRALGITDGARLRLVLGMRGGPISTRRLPPPPGEPWRDIERLLDSHRDESWSGSGSGCKVTVLVFRDGERVNMLRVKENRDGSYSPIEHTKYVSDSSRSEASPVPAARDGACAQNALTQGKMVDLRRRMEGLSLRRRQDTNGEKKEMQKTRSEETLSVAHLLDEPGEFPRTYTPYSEADDFTQLYDGNYTRYDYDCSFADRYTLLPPIGTRTDSEQSITEESEHIKLSDALAGSYLVKNRRGKDDAILEELDECHIQDSAHPDSLASIPAQYGAVALGAWSARRPPHRARRPARLADALFTSSTSDLEKLRRNTRILPTLSRHRNREHLHLSDEGLDSRDLQPEPRDTHDIAEMDSRLFRFDLQQQEPRTAEEPPESEFLCGRGFRVKLASTFSLIVTYCQASKEPAPPKKLRIRCGLCRKRLTVSTVHRCRCGAEYCAPHRYAEVHGCAYDYKAVSPAQLARDYPTVLPPKLPKI